MAKVNLMTREVRGVKYGCGRCTVGIGPTELDGVAVAAGDNQWISTEADCLEWLARHGLTREEARSFLATGLKAWDESHAVGIA